MIHMLSAFEIRPGEDETTFETAYRGFVSDLRAEDLIVSAGPVGRRVTGTPMDTDDTRAHTHFSVMSFRDRKQLDHAYAWLTHRKGASAGSHHDINARIANSVFLCWQDIAETTQEET